VSCRVVSCRVVSCRVVSCRVVSWLVVACRVVSCLALSSLVLSCSYLVLFLSPSKSRTCSGPRHRLLLFFDAVPFFCLILCFLVLCDVVVVIVFFQNKMRETLANFICVVLSCDCCLALYMLSCVVFSLCGVVLFVLFLTFNPAPPSTFHTKEGVMRVGTYGPRGLYS
jgi:hypothetical protein